MCANDEEDEDVEKTGEDSNGLPDDVKGGIVADDKSDSITYLCFSLLALAFAMMLKISKVWGYDEASTSNCSSVL